MCNKSITVVRLWLEVQVFKGPGSKHEPHRMFSKDVSVLWRVRRSFVSVLTVSLCFPAIWSAEYSGTSLKPALTSHWLQILRNCELASKVQLGWEEGTGVPNVTGTARELRNEAYRLFLLAQPPS